VRQRDQDHDQCQRQRRADSGPRQHGQQKAVHEHPRQQRQRDRKRPVLGEQQDRQRGQMHGNDQAGQSKESGAARFRAGAFAHSGFGNG
jgi:hypothetical protein